MTFCVIMTERLKWLQWSDKCGNACYVKRCMFALSTIQRRCSLLVGSNNKHYGICNFPTFVGPNFSSDGQTNRLLICVLCWTKCHLKISNRLVIDRSIDVLNTMFVPGGCRLVVGAWGRVPWGSWGSGRVQGRRHRSHDGHTLSQGKATL